MATSTSSTPKTTFRTFHTICVENVKAAMTHHKHVKSDQFFCRHDPDPVVHQIELWFGHGSWLDTPLSPETGWISLYHQVKNRAITVIIATDFWIYDDKGKLLKRMRESVGGKLEQGEGGGFGYPQLYLIDDLNTIRCDPYNGEQNWRMVFEVEYQASGPDVLNPTDASHRDASFPEDILHLFESGDQADVTFMVRDEKIVAHKLILSIRWPYFKTLFESGMKESVDNQISITDVDPEVFKELLRFLYSGMPPKIESGGEYAPVVKLLAAADKYDLNVLKDLCAKVLSDQVNASNVIGTLIAADVYRCPALFERGAAVFRAHAATVKLQAGFSLLKKHPNLLLKLLSNYCE